MGECDTLSFLIVPNALELPFFSLSTPTRDIFFKESDSVFEAYLVAYHNISQFQEILLG